MPPGKTTVTSPLSHLVREDKKQKEEREAMST